MRAQSDADRFADADPDRDPEMIDVCRDAIDFGSESDGLAGDMDEVAVVKTRVNRPDAWLVSMRQRLGERWRWSALGLLVVHCGQTRGIVLPLHKTDQAEQSDRQRGDVISGERAE